MRQFMGKNSGDLLVAALQHQAQAELDHLPVGTRIDAALVIEKLDQREAFPRRRERHFALDTSVHASGREDASTNQRMEIRAALEAVRSLDGPLLVVSDSTYVVNCFRDLWWRGWLDRGWVNSARKPVANRDLWEPLITLFVERGDVAFTWVKGHSGHAMNDFVDRLAVAASKGPSPKNGATTLA